MSLEDYKLVNKEGKTPIADALLDHFTTLFQKNVGEFKFTHEDEPYTINSFDWDQSPEGYAFWSYLYEQTSVEHGRQAIDVGSVAGYDAEVLHDGSLKIGCKTVPWSKIEEIMAAVLKQREAKLVSKKGETPHGT